MSNDSRKTFYFKRQRGTCYLRTESDCQIASGRMDIRARGRRLATWDHIKPKSDGGSDAFNTLLACRACNMARGSRRATPSHLEMAIELGRLWHKWNHGRNKAKRDLMVMLWEADHPDIVRALSGNPA